MVDLLIGMEFAVVQIDGGAVILERVVDVGKVNAVQAGNQLVQIAGGGIMAMSEIAG